MWRLVVTIGAPPPRKPINTAPFLLYLLGRAIVPRSQFGVQMEPAVGSPYSTVATMEGTMKYCSHGHLLGVCCTVQYNTATVL